MRPNSEVPEVLAIRPLPALLPEFSRYTSADQGCKNGQT